jgi:hypothetical protein
VMNPQALILPTNEDSRDDVAGTVETQYLITNEISPRNERGMHMNIHEND